MEQTIQETTVFRFDENLRISAINIGDGEYTLADGSTQKGLVATLKFMGAEERRQLVGEGSIVNINDETWKVKKVTKPSVFNARGEVTLVTVE